MYEDKKHYLMYQSIFVSYQLGRSTVQMLVSVCFHSQLGVCLKFLLVRRHLIHHSIKDGKVLTLVCGSFEGGSVEADHYDSTYELIFVEKFL